ncbi:MAG: AAA family ATPase [Saprospiraceae bacterium]|nr:AAA family ATPase [Candidatus Brachybacter algidus]
MKDENKSNEVKFKVGTQYVLRQEEEPQSIPPLSIEDIKKDVTEHIQKCQENNDEVTGEELLNMEVENEPLLIDPMLRTSGIVCLAGSSDTGKSAFLRFMAIAIVAGKEEFIGFRLISRHKSVLYVSTEDLAKDTKRLLHIQAYNVDPSHLQRLRFIFDSENLLAKIDKSLSRKPVDLVILDCFSDIFDYDLKDTSKIRGFLKPYHQLSQKFDCLFLFLHHNGKRTEFLDPNKNHLLGGQGFEAKMRLVIQFVADPKKSNIRHLCLVKGNYLASSAKKESYVLEFDEEHLCFKNTGARLPFGHINKKEDYEAKRKLHDMVLELKNEGNTYDQIANQLDMSNRSVPYKLLQKGRENGWNTDDTDEVDESKDEIQE